MSTLKIEKAPKLAKKSKMLGTNASIRYLPEDQLVKLLDIRFCTVLQITCPAMYIHYMQIVWPSAKKERDQRVVDKRFVQSIKSLLPVRMTR